MDRKMRKQVRLPPIASLLSTLFPKPLARYLHPACGDDFVTLRSSHRHLFTYKLCLMHRSPFHHAVVWLVLTGVAASSFAAPRTSGISKRPDFKAYQGSVFPKEAPILAGAWSVQPAFPGLTFQNPMGLTTVPGTNDLLVWEREGRLWRFANDPVTTEKRLILDLSSQCQGWHDSGLLGVAPHPDYANNGQLFVFYTAVPDGQVSGSAERQPATEIANHDRLVRYTCAAGGLADPASATVFIDQIAETVWHEGGGLFFGPKDGFLDLSVGDDARAPTTNGSSGGLFSGVLRLDVDCRGGEISHAPVRKPLPEGKLHRELLHPKRQSIRGPGYSGRIFALGLRNPHRIDLRCGERSNLHRRCRGRRPGGTQCHRTSRSTRAELPVRIFRKARPTKR